MGDGEYNNLGQYKVYDAETRKEIVRLDDIILETPETTENSNNVEFSQQFAERLSQSVDFTSVNKSVKGLTDALAEANKRLGEVLAKTTPIILMSIKAYRRYERQTKSNNWLKQHGFPMRRKVRK